MKKRILAALFLTTIIASCDDRLAQLQIINQAPKVEFMKNKIITVELNDSLRLIPGAKNVYNIHLRVSDENRNIQFLNWAITKGNYKLYYQENEVELPNSFRTDYGNLILNFYPAAPGDYGASFKATDRFGKEAIGQFNLFVFDNLLPIPILKVVQQTEDPFIYTIDASESYDPDKNFHGGIIKYQFTIDGQILELKNPILQHVFDKKGEHLVKLKVFDNSGGESQIIVNKISINP